MDDSPFALYFELLTEGSLADWLSALDGRAIELADMDMVREQLSMDQIRDQIQDRDNNATTSENVAYWQSLQGVDLAAMMQVKEKEERFQTT